jgi:hypothetical protein
MYFIVFSEHVMVRITYHHTCYIHNSVNNATYVLYVAIAVPVSVHEV